MNLLHWNIISILTLVVCSTVHSQPVEQNNDKIHFGDTVQIKLLGFPEYDWTGSLNSEGFIDTLTLSEEPIFALCQTEESLARLIEKSYSKFIRNPKVVVRIIDTSKRPAVVVYGAVRKPSRFQVKRTVKLDEIIALANGLTEKASGEILLTRSKFSSCSLNIEFDSIRIKINVSDLLAGKEESNPTVLAGDIIEVTEASSIYIFGAVARTGRIYFRNNVNLSQAIALAGGITKKADGNALVFRKENQTLKVIKVNIKNDNPPLKARDVIEVLEKGKSRSAPPLLESEEEQDLLQLPLKVIE